MNYMPDYLEATYKDEATKSDYALKLRIARNALTTHPQDKEYLLAHIAVFLHRDAKYVECITHCREVLPQLANEECRETVELFLGYALQSAGRLEEAIEFHKSQLPDTDDEADVYEEIAKLYEELKDEDNMVKYYEQVITADKDCDYAIHLKLADVYNDKKEYANASRQYEMYARKNWNEGDIWWAEVGRTLALQHKTDEAMFYFKMSLALNPEYATAHYMLGLAYQQKDDAYRAMHHYVEALKAKPDYPEAVNNMASITYNEHSDIKAAIELLDKALQMTVSDELRTTIYINMIRLHKQIGEYDKQEYYNSKLLESLGFPPDFTGEEGEDDFDLPEDGKE